MAYHPQRLDFDEWQALARSDPEAFEVMRRRVLQSVIERAPERSRRRLKGLQWRVDQVRRRAVSPMAACISLSDMMWEAFAGDNGLAQALRGGLDAAGRGGKVAEVIPLRKTHGKRP